MNDAQISESSEGETPTETIKEVEEKIEQQAPTKDSDLPIIDRARKVSEEMQKVNAETRALLDRREKLMAEEMIQGKALAGLVEKKELSPQEYADKVLNGEINPLK